MTKMLQVNEYFDGNVKSIALENGEGNSTIGVMDAGEYEFGTSSVEYMNVVSGTIEVKLPGENEWKTFTKGETFIVEKDKKFQVKMSAPVAYLCTYK